MKVSAELPQGVTALLFDSARRRRELERRLVGSLEEAGFQEVILPILDYLEPYEPLLTPASRGELYRFVDRDGELLALRSDFTPLLARVLAPSLAPQEDGRRALPLPQRLFYRGDVVRYEEERPGRQREFSQVGAELLGVAGEEAEREMLGLFVALLSAAAGRAGEAEGGSPVRVVLGLAGALDRALREAAEEGQDPVALANAVARRERGPVRRAGGLLAAVVEHGAPDDPADLGPQAARRYHRLLSLRDELAAEYPGVELVVDLAEFAHQVMDPDLQAAAEERSYYDGLVFRGYAGDLALPAGSGGRYDDLFSRLGADVPAVGFSFGLERLLAETSRSRRPAGARGPAAPAGNGEEGAP